MRNSEEDASPRKILEQIWMLLDESRLAREVEGPIDAAAQRFELHVRSPLSARDFNEAVSGFVMHVYEEGLAVRYTLSGSQSLAEAMLLLDGHYQGTACRGYCGALLDANQPPPLGLQAVLSKLSGIIAAVQRQRRVAWALVQTLGPLSWTQRCGVTELLIDHYGPHLPQQLRQCPPEQLAEDIPTMLACFLEVQRAMHQICG